MAKEKEFTAVEEVLAAPPKILVRAPQNKSFSFDQWAKLKNTPAHHVGGMKAFLGTRVGFKYPLDQWDEIFKSY